MNNLYPIIISSIAGFSTILGNILLFINPKYKDKILSFGLGLSFIVMFLISIIELIPEGLLLVKNTFNVCRLFGMSLVLLFIGYFLVTFIDQKIKSDDALYKVGFLSMLSILIHNIPEGIICAITSSTNLELGLKMSFIILIHNIPEGITISLPIYYATKSKWKAFIYTVISGLGEVIGAIITILFLRPFISSFLLYFIFLITAGIMITLSVKKILMESLKYHQYIYLILGIIIGCIIVFLTI